MRRRKSGRRRVRAWWGRRPWKEKSYAVAYNLHRFENDVILRKVRELPTNTPGLWTFSAKSLKLAYPDLFNGKLARTLKRMHDIHLIDGGRRGGSIHWSRIYTLDERAHQTAGKRRAA